MASSSSLPPIQSYPALPPFPNGGTLVPAASQGIRLREVGNQAVWTLSSAKSGNGIEQLRDDSTDTYWQSDSVALPHLITLQFPKLMSLQTLRIYLDYKADESYTPQKISIRSGLYSSEPRELKVIELEQPIGWIDIPLGREDDDEPDAADGEEKKPKQDKSALNRVLRCTYLQICIITNHQNGRDTHVRQVKIYSPAADVDDLITGLSYSTVEFAQHACIR